MCRMLLPSRMTKLIIIILILTISCSVVVNVVTGHRHSNDIDDVILNIENDDLGSSGHHREPVNDANQEPLKLLYGAEVSWPMQQQLLPLQSTTTTTSLLMNNIGTKYPTYVEFMNGCYETYDIPTCQYNDAIRIQRNDIQPKIVHKNFTHAGYAKVLAPSTTFHILREYWDRYSTSHLQFENESDDGSSSSSSCSSSSSRQGMPTKDNINMHMNHWVAPTKILYLDPPPSLPQRRPTTVSSTSTSASSVQLPLMSTSNIHTMIEQIQSVLEQWTGVPLQFTSIYGIRSYTNHSILTPHIDRIPLVISAIVNVAQHVNDDWVLELIGHDGYATNLTMQPGEMIIYESHSIIHGRPYPLNGQHYANCFFHYEPIGYSEQYYANLERRRRVRDTSSPQVPTSGEGDDRFIRVKTTQEKFEAALAKLERNGHQSTSQALSTESVVPPEHIKTMSPIQLPYYISEGTVEAQRWRQEFEFHRVTLRHESVDDFDDELFPKIIIPKKNTGNTVGATSAHILAARNDIVRLRQVARTDPKSLDTPDINGWLPLHEAARGGCTEVVKFLVETYRVADINARTNAGEGGTALWWAEHGLPEDHEVIRILKRNGAVSIAPFQKKTNVVTLDDGQSENDMSDVDEEDQVEE